MGGLTNTSTPTGAHTLKQISPLVPGDKTVTQPGKPDIAISATAPESLLTWITCMNTSQFYQGNSMLKKGATLWHVPMIFEMCKCLTHVVIDLSVALLYS